MVCNGRKLPSPNCLWLSSTVCDLWWWWPSFPFKTWRDGMAWWRLQTYVSNLCLHACCVTFLEKEKKRRKKNGECVVYVWWQWPALCHVCAACISCLKNRKGRKEEEGEQAGQGHMLCVLLLSLLSMSLHL